MSISSPSSVHLFVADSFQSLQKRRKHCQTKILKSNPKKGKGYTNLQHNDRVTTNDLAHRLSNILKNWTSSGLATYHHANSDLLPTSFLLQGVVQHEVHEDLKHRIYQTTVQNTSTSLPVNPTSHCPAAQCTNRYSYGRYVHIHRSLSGCQWLCGRRSVGRTPASPCTNNSEGGRVSLILLLRNLPGLWTSYLLQFRLSLTHLGWFRCLWVRTYSVFLSRGLLTCGWQIWPARGKDVPGALKC